MSTILLVEGNPEHMKNTTEFLTHQGHSILDANNAGDGIRIAKELQPDLIMLSERLPGMNNLLTAQLLKANPITRNIKIIAFSEVIEDREKLLKAGADTYLKRPYAEDELLNLIRDILETGKSTSIKDDLLGNGDNGGSKKRALRI